MDTDDLQDYRPAYSALDPDTGENLVVVWHPHRDAPSLLPRDVPSTADARLSRTPGRCWSGENRKSDHKGGLSMRCARFSLICMVLAWGTLEVSAQTPIVLGAGEAITVSCIAVPPPPPPPATGVVTGSSLQIGETFLPYLSDFEYDAPNQKARMRSLLLADLNDTPDLALRRVNGAIGAPTAVLPNELVGVFYWQPFGTNGDYGTGLGSPYYGRIAQFHARAIGQQTAASRAGRLGWGTGRPGDTVIRERGFIDEYGRLIVTGRANVEDGRSDSTMNTAGLGWLTVFAPRQEVGPALSMRFSTDPGYGFDFELNASTGELELWSVRGGVRVRKVQSWPY